MDDSSRYSFLSVVKSNSDLFCERGVSRPVLNFEFGIDTKDLPSMRYPQPNNVFHEHKIANHQIAALKFRGLIADFEEGVWISLLLLAIKYHQEKCADISAFVWKLCVSYRPLNSITLSFECSSSNHYPKRK